MRRLLRWLRKGLAAGLAAAWLAGCHGPMVEEVPDTLAAYSPVAREFQMTLTDEAGDYTLSGPWPSRPVVRRLAAGVRLGFERSAGQLYAVAGDERIPLENGRYAWHGRRTVQVPVRLTPPA